MKIKIIGDFFVLSVTVPLWLVAAMQKDVDYLPFG
jgi:hypothetical protein